MHAHMHAYTHVCVHAHMHVCTHLCMHTFVYACTHACMHTCTHVRMYLHVRHKTGYTHTHTRTHTGTQGMHALIYSCESVTYFTDFKIEVICRYAKFAARVLQTGVLVLDSKGFWSRHMALPGVRFRTLPAHYLDLTNLIKVPYRTPNPCLCACIGVCVRAHACV